MSNETPAGMRWVQIPEYVRGASFDASIHPADYFAAIERG